MYQGGGSGDIFMKALDDLKEEDYKKKHPELNQQQQQTTQQSQGMQNPAFKMLLEQYQQKGYQLTSDQVAQLYQQFLMQQSYQQGVSQPQMMGSTGMQPQYGMPTTTSYIGYPQQQQPTTFTGYPGYGGMPYQPTPTQGFSGGYQVPFQQPQQQFNPQLQQQYGSGGLQYGLTNQPTTQQFGTQPLNVPQQQHGGFQAPNTQFYGGQNLMGQSFPNTQYQAGGFQYGVGQQPFMTPTTSGINPQTSTGYPTTTTTGLSQQGSFGGGISTPTTSTTSFNSQQTVNTPIGKVGMTSTESDYYKKLFEAAKNGMMQLGARELADFIKKAGLQTPALKQIWGACIPQGTVSVGWEVFILVMKMIALVQNGQNPTKETLQTQEIKKLPVFQGIQLPEEDFFDKEDEDFGEFNTVQVSAQTTQATEKFEKNYNALDDFSLEQPKDTQVTSQKPISGPTVVTQPQTQSWGGQGITQQGYPTPQQVFGGGQPQMQQGWPQQQNSQVLGGNQPGWGPSPYTQPIGTQNLMGQQQQLQQPSYNPTGFLNTPVNQINPISPTGLQSMEQSVQNQNKKDDSFEFHDAQPQPTQTIGKKPDSDDDFDFHDAQPQPQPQSQSQPTQAIGKKPDSDDDFDFHEVQAQPQPQPTQNIGKTEISKKPDSDDDFDFHDAQPQIQHHSQPTYGIGETEKAKKADHKDSDDDFDFHNVPQQSGTLQKDDDGFDEWNDATPTKQPETESKGNQLNFKNPIPTPGTQQTVNPIQEYKPQGSRYDAFDELDADMPTMTENKVTNLNPPLNQTTQPVPQHKGSDEWNWGGSGPTHQQPVTTGIQSFPQQTIGQPSTQFPQINTSTKGANITDEDDGFDFHDATPADPYAGPLNVEIKNNDAVIEEETFSYTKPIKPLPSPDKISPNKINPIASPDRVNPINIYGTQQNVQKQEMKITNLASPEEEDDDFNFQDAPIQNATQQDKKITADKGDHGGDNDDDFDFQDAPVQTVTHQENKMQASNNDNGGDNDDDFDFQDAPVQTATQQETKKDDKDDFDFTTYQPSTSKPAETKPFGFGQPTVDTMQSKSQQPVFTKQSIFDIDFGEVEIKQEPSPLTKPNDLLGAPEELTEQEKSLMADAEKLIQQLAEQKQSLSELLNAHAQPDEHTLRKVFHDFDDLQKDISAKVDAIIASTKIPEKDKAFLEKISSELGLTSLIAEQTKGLLDGQDNWMSYKLICGGVLKIPVNDNKPKDLLEQDDLMEFDFKPIQSEPKVTENKIVDNFDWNKPLGETKPISHPERKQDEVEIEDDFDWNDSSPQQPTTIHTEQKTHHAPVQRDLTDEDDGFEFNQAGSAKKDDDHHWDFGGVQTEHKTQHEDHFANIEDETTRHEEKEVDIENLITMNEDDFGHQKRKKSEILSQTLDNIENSENEIFILKLESKLNSSRFLSDYCRQVMKQEEGKRVFDAQFWEELAKELHSYEFAAEGDACLQQIKIQDEINELEKQKKAALAEEEYEKAAKIRDEVKKKSAAVLSVDKINQLLHLHQSFKGDFRLALLKKVFQISKKRDYLKALIKRYFTDDQPFSEETKKEAMLFYLQAYRLEEENEDYRETALKILQKCFEDLEKFIAIWRDIQFDDEAVLQRVYAHEKFKTYFKATNIVESIAERVMQNLDQFQFETSSLKFLRMKLKGSLDIYKNAKRELVKGNKLEEPQLNYDPVIPDDVTDKIFDNNFEKSYTEGICKLSLAADSPRKVHYGSGYFLPEYINYWLNRVC